MEDSIGYCCFINQNQQRTILKTYNIEEHETLITPNRNKFDTEQKCLPQNRLKIINSDFGNIRGHPIQWKIVCDSAATSI